MAHVEETRAVRLVVERAPMTGTQARLRPRLTPVAVGLAGLVVAIVFMSVIVETAGGLTGLLRVSEGDEEFVAYFERLTNQSVIQWQGGHDGKFFFVQALDPFLLEPDKYAHFFDRPAYRTQRMLYPALAGSLGLLAPSHVLWGLVLVNIAAMAVGSWALARVASALGGSPVLGLFFVFNPGLILEMALDGSSAVAWAFATWGLAAMADESWNFASILLSFAVLARESMGIVVVGAFAYLLFVHRGRVWRILLVPAIAGVAWSAWISLRVGRFPLMEGSLEIGLSMRGLSRAIPTWIDAGGDTLIVGLMVLSCSAVVLIEAVRRPNILSWGTAGFVPLLLILNGVVLNDGLNLARALTPVLSAGLALLLISVGPEARTLEAEARGVTPMTEADGHGGAFIDPVSR